MAEDDNGPLLPRWLLVVAGVVAGGCLIFLLRGALTPVLFALLIAYMLDPLVDRFEARGLSRAVGIAVMTVALVLVMAGMIFLVVPGIVRETISFAGQLPETLMSALARAEPFLAQFGVSVPSSFDEAREQLAHIDSSKLVEQAGTQLTGAASFVVGGTFSLLGALAGLLMIPVFAAYLLYDFDRMTAAIAALVPGRHRALVLAVARDVDVILGEFIRGQLLVMLALVVLYGLGYLIVGVPLALVIGVVAGLLSFIPYVGGAVALGMALLMSLLHWTGWGQIVGIAVVYTVVQLLESFVITPKIVGDKVGLPAIWVLFALLVGAELFGFLGVLLALPAAAVTKIFVVRGMAWYRASAFFLDGDPGEPDPPPPPPLPPPPPDEAVGAPDEPRVAPDGLDPADSMAPTRPAAPLLPEDHPSD